jgi:hypothetical protein
MNFRATPLNVSTLLLVAFALYVLHFLSKQKLDSNLPLLFYIGLVIFTNSTGRQVNPYLLTSGLALALLLRFEFLNGGFTRIVLWLEMLAVTGIAVNFLREAFS